MASVVSTAGNPDCHVILRGATAATNYDADSVAAAAALLRKAQVSSPSFSTRRAAPRRAGAHVPARHVLACVGRDMRWLRRAPRSRRGQCLPSRQALVAASAGSGKRW